MSAFAIGSSDSNLNIQAVADVIEAKGEIHVLEFGTVGFAI